MTVRELIQLLEKQPPEMKVVVRGYEAGYNDAIRLEEVEVLPYKNREWYYGCHSEVYSWTHSKKKAVKMIEICGGREDGKAYE